MDICGGIIIYAIVHMLVYVGYTRKYAIIKKEFSFLQLNYGFQVFSEQKQETKHTPYYFICYTNETKNIMIVYDDRINEKKENPVTIRIYDADCLGTAYDDVDEFRNEFFIPSGRPKERIQYAAKWLKEAIEGKTISIE